MKLVFATNNKHKLEEVQGILGTSFSILSLSDISCHEDIPETADTLEGNALQKAQYVKEHYGYDCFADDTGLEVECLDGAPGIYSARYASLMENDSAESHDSEANMRCLLAKMAEAESKAATTNRKAQFRTAIALILNGETHIFEGIVKGEIATERHGAEGFGYDPIFYPEGNDRTFAEMSADEKNAISHRGRAVAKLTEFLQKN